MQNECTVLAERSDQVKCVRMGTLCEFDLTPDFKSSRNQSPRSDSIQSASYPQLLK